MTTSRRSNVDSLQSPKPPSTCRRLKLLISSFSDVHLNRTWCCCACRHEPAVDAGWKNACISSVAWDTDKGVPVYISAFFMWVSISGYAWDDHKSCMQRTSTPTSPLHSLTWTVLLPFSKARRCHEQQCQRRPIGFLNPRLFWVEWYECFNCACTYTVYYTVGSRYVIWSACVLVEVTHWPLLCEINSDLVVDVWFVTLSVEIKCSLVSRLRQRLREDRNQPHASSAKSQLSRP